MTLEIALLGSPVILVDRAPLDVDTRKATALLAYLASEPGPVQRDTLSVLLWPDYPQDRSRAALRRTLSSLRKGLGDRWIGTTRSVVELVDDEGMRVDTHRFERLSEADDLDSQAEAGHLYRGDFMAGFSLRDSPEFDDWQANRAAYYRRIAAGLFEQLSESEAGLGDYPAAIGNARRWLDLDPLHEPAHQALMRLHALAGDRTAALQQYRDCVATLEDELGVAPLPETTELYHEITEGRLHPATTKRPRARGLLKATQRPKSTFVGREDSLAVLASAVASDDINMVAVTGEPGIGKTRLAEEFVAGIGRGTVIIRAAARRTSTSSPFGVVIEALGNGLAAPEAGQRLEQVSEIDRAMAALLVPELSREAGTVGFGSQEGPGRHARLVKSTASVLLALAEDGVVVMDDLQWADADSLEVLAAATRRAGPVLILALYRATELSASDPLPSLARDGARVGHAAVIELGRLTEEEVSLMVEAAVPDRRALADDIVRLSEGVPYFAMEYLAAISTDPEAPYSLPVGVRDLLIDRTARLGDLAAQLLAAAAVLGRSFSLEDVQAVSGRTEDESFIAMEELLAQGLIRETSEPDTFDFDHDRLRQFTYERMTALRRRRLHGRAADRILTQAPADEASAAVAATHLEAGGRLDEAAEQHLRAATYAASLFANQTAIEHLNAALALAHPEAAAIRESMADLDVLAGRYGNALSNLRAAMSTTDGSDGARLEHKMGMIHARAGEWDHAEAHLMSASEELEDDLALVHLWVDWAWVAHRRGRTSRAADLAHRALQEAENSSSDEALAQAHNILGIITRASDPPGSRRQFELALEQAEDLHPTVRAAALNNLGLARLSEGQPEVGMALASEALEIYSTVGDRHKAAAVHSNLADLLHAAGKDDEARSHLKKAALIFTEVGLEPGSLEPEIWKLTEW